MLSIDRPYWHDRIERAWKSAPIAWLSGVRRVGKTTLARSFSDALYLNCDLPSTAERVAEPERFFRSLGSRRVVLDEVHQLPDPSRLLKIAADEFPALRVLATGSSTLAATQKFRDSLAGRKRTVHLLPVLVSELPAFGVPELRRRMLSGGLPAALMSDEPAPDLFAEWLDSYFARDIQELFRVEKRTPFLALVRTLLRQSGGLAETSSLARLVGLSRPTVMTYLNVLEVTHVVTVLRPFHRGGASELTHQPKIYGFDTGFVSWSRGWNELHAADYGQLWEHLVLETLLARSEREGRPVHFWRDKQRREVDFVVPGRRGEIHAIECKSSASALDGKALSAFRTLHPRGRNVVVVPHERTRERRLGALDVTVTSLETLGDVLG